MYWKGREPSWKTGIITQLFVQLGSILGAMTESRFVAITPWPGGEREGIHSFVGGELNFQKLGSVLVGLSGGVLNIS